MSSFLVTYNGNSYDIQKYLSSHPGGENILLPYKDCDITEAFDNIGHSNGAKRTMNKYLIENDQIVVVEEKKEKKQNIFTLYDPYHIYKISGMIAWYVIINNITLEDISTFAETISKNCLPISFFQRP